MRLRKKVNHHYVRSVSRRVAATLTQLGKYRGAATYDSTRALISEENTRKKVEPQRNLSRHVEEPKKRTKTKNPENQDSRREKLSVNKIYRDIKERKFITILKNKKPNKSTRSPLHYDSVTKS